MSPDSLTRTVSDFLAGSRGAVVLENGAILFDLAQSKYSISGESNKCLLHLWSAERNIVRRVLDAEIKNQTLRLAVQRLGQPRPTKLEICRERDRRTPNARRAARVAYQRTLRRVLERSFPAYTVVRLSTAMDLEQSFGPIYTRGLIRQGQSAYAVLGVNKKRPSPRSTPRLPSESYGSTPAASRRRGGWQSRASSCSSPPDARRSPANAWPA